MPPPPIPFIAPGSLKVPAIKSRERGVKDKKIKKTYPKTMSLRVLLVSLLAHVTDWKQIMRNLISF